MARQLVPKCAEVAIKYLVNGADCTNILHFTKGAGAAFTLPELSGLASAVSGAWAGGILQSLCSTVLGLSCTATDISALGGMQAVNTADMAFTGSVNTPTLPSNVAFAVKFLTGRVGRSFRGRNYIAGLGESQVGGNQISTALADAFVQGYVDIRSAIQDEGWEWVVVSRTIGGVVNTPPLTFKVTDINYTDVRVDTMRSRLRF